MNSKVIGVAKKIITVGVGYALIDIFYQAGKGNMLGILLADDGVTAKEMSEELQKMKFDDAPSNFRLAIINGCAKSKFKKMKKD